MIEKEPVFFESAFVLRKWFTRNHKSAAVLWVGFRKKATGHPSVTWPEAVDEALCVGWIDGIRKSVDDTSYKIRFTPRKSGSIWSAINIRRAEALIAEGRMKPAGAQAFAARQENKSGIYSYEQRSVDLPEPYAVIFREHEAAWKYYHSLSAYWRKTFNWWVISAKREETRLGRLDTLIESSKRNEVIEQFRIRGKGK